MCVPPADPFWHEPRVNTDGRAKYTAILLSLQFSDFSSTVPDENIKDTQTEQTKHVFSRFFFLRTRKTLAYTRFCFTQTEKDTAKLKKEKETSRGRTNTATKSGYAHTTRKVTRLLLGNLREKFGSRHGVPMMLRSLGPSGSWSVFLLRGAVSEVKSVVVVWRGSCVWTVTGVCCVRAHGFTCALLTSRSSEAETEKTRN